MLQVQCPIPTIIFTGISVLLWEKALEAISEAGG